MKQPISRKAIVRYARLQLFNKIKELLAQAAVFFGEENVYCSVLNFPEQWEEYIDNICEAQIGIVQQRGLRHFDFNTSLSNFNVIDLLSDIEYVIFNPSRRSSATPLTLYIVDKMQSSCTLIELFSEIEQQTQTLVDEPDWFNAASILPIIPIIIRFPHIIIRNEHLTEHNIDNLFVKFFMYPNGKFVTCCIYGTRSQVTRPEFRYHYEHSHLPSGGAFKRFRKFCTGTGPFDSLLEQLTVNNSSALWMEFFDMLRTYVRIESLAGVPYRYIERIATEGGESSNTVSGTTYYMPLTNYKLNCELLGNVVLYRFTYSILYYYCKYLVEEGFMVEFGYTYNGTATYNLGDRGLFQLLLSSEFPNFLRKLTSVDGLSNVKTDAFSKIITFSVEEETETNSDLSDEARFIVHLAAARARGTADKLIIGRFKQAGFLVQGKLDAKNGMSSTVSTNEDSSGETQSDEPYYMFKFRNEEIYFNVESNSVLTGSVHTFFSMKMVHFILSILNLNLTNGLNTLYPSNEPHNFGADRYPLLLLI